MCFSPSLSRSLTIAVEQPHPDGGHGGDEAGGSVLRLQVLADARQRLEHLGHAAPSQGEGQQGELRLWAHAAAGGGGGREAA